MKFTKNEIFGERKNKKFNKRFNPIDDSLGS